MSWLPDCHVPLYRANYLMPSSVRLQSNYWITKEKQIKLRDYLADSKLSMRRISMILDVDRNTVLGYAKRWKLRGW